MIGTTKSYSLTRLAKQFDACAGFIESSLDNYNTQESGEEVKEQRDLCPLFHQQHPLTEWHHSIWGEWGHLWAVWTRDHDWGASRYTDRGDQTAAGQSFIIIDLKYIKKSSVVFFLDTFWIFWLQYNGRVFFSIFTLGCLVLYFCVHILVVIPLISSYIQ